MNRAHVFKRCGVIDVAEMEREGEERITEQSIYMSMAQDRSPYTPRPLSVHKLFFVLRETVTIRAVLYHDTNMFQCLVLFLSTVQEYLK